MKTGRRGLFWSLSPTAAAQSLERWCWLAAAALVLSLALGVGPAAAASPRAAATPLPEDPQVLFLQRRCIDHVLGQAAVQTDEAIAQQINQRCMTLRRGRPNPRPRILLACQRPIAVPVVPLTGMVAGCPGG